MSDAGGEAAEPFPRPPTLVLSQSTSPEPLTGTPTWGRFPATLPVSAHNPPCRPSVVWLLRYLSPRGSIKPQRDQRRARDPRLGPLARRSRRRDSQEWGHLPTAGKFQPGSGMSLPWKVSGPSCGGMQGQGSPSSAAGFGRRAGMKFGDAAAGGGAGHPSSARRRGTARSPLYPRRRSHPQSPGARARALSPAYLARRAGHGRDAGAPGAGRHRAGGCRGSIARRRAEARPPCALRAAPGPAPGPARRRCRRMAAPAFRRRRGCGYARRGADLRPPRAGGGGSAEGRPQRLLRAAHPAGPP